VQHRPDRAGSAALRPALILGVALAGVAGAAQAATYTGNFNVLMTVQPACTISAVPLAFGTYNPTAGASATATISVSCTNTTPYNVGLDAGTTGSSSIAQRLLINGAGNKIGYSMYKDAAHTMVWGQTVGTDTVAGTANGGTQQITVYGLLPGGQYAFPGTYTDTITATITY
jgi:spore coat protein U-like protein